MKKNIAKSDKDTRRLGEEFAKNLRPGDIVFLYGDLGFGKTTFVKGVASGLGVTSRILSPTFPIIRRHDNLYHLDLYRIDDEINLKEMGIFEIMEDPSSIKLIEWPEKIENKNCNWKVEITMNTDSTRTIKISKNEPEKEMSNLNVQRVVKALKNSEIVIFPTDTAYGIGCRMDSVTSVKRIFNIRQRDEKNPLLILVSSIKMAEKYVKIGKKVKAFINSYWPGGVTLILPCRKDVVPGVVRSGGETLAVRMPKHAELLEVIKRVGVPIVAPSANRSGEKTPYTLEDLDEGLVEQVDEVLGGECTYKKESTIIDTTVNPWKVVREGAVKINFDI